MACRMGRIEADLEDFGSRKEKGEKGDLEQGKQEQSRSVWPGHPFLSSRAVAKASWESGDAHVQSTAMRRPRPQAVRARGALLLPFRLPARPSPGAPWARGLLSVFWERGSADLPACGLRRGSKGIPVRPIFTNMNPRPSRGAKPRGADDRKLPQEQPRQAGSRGGGEIKAGYLARCL